MRADEIEWGTASIAGVLLVQAGRSAAPRSPTESTVAHLLRPREARWSIMRIKTDGLSPIQRR